MGAAPPLARLRLTGTVLAAVLGTGGCATNHLAEPWDDRIVAEGPYVDGERHGEWTLRWPYGLVAGGSYDRGEERGEWYYRYPDGGCKVVTYNHLREVRVEEQPLGNLVMLGPGHVVLEHLVARCNPPDLWLTSWLAAEAKERAVKAAEEALGLTREQRRRIQESLAAAGFDPGPPDGVFSPHTRMAIGRWQRERSYEVTGYLAKGQVLALMGWRWLALMGGESAREAGGSAPGGQRSSFRLGTAVNKGRWRTMLRRFVRESAGRPSAASAGLRPGRERRCRRAATPGGAP